jgi:hypothetical protein
MAMPNATMTLRMIILPLVWPNGAYPSRGQLHLS